jgi:hypothetical protein
MAYSYYAARMYRTVSVKLEDRVLADIEAEARARRTTRSAVVRERLERPGAAGGSLWDRMRDLVIADDAAPRDLARNKSRLRGLGRSRRR